MDFGQLRKANIERLKEIHRATLDWTIGDWGCAAAGEMGELCNFLKKVRRGEEIACRDVADEIADVIVYLDIIAHQFNIDLGGAVRTKFNATSDKYGSPTKIS
jgi:NTP pyrophosphatase (non-canonical NTP hydrolase)